MTNSQKSAGFIIQTVGKPLICNARTVLLRHHATGMPTEATNLHLNRCYLVLIKEELKIAIIEVSTFN